MSAEPRGEAPALALLSSLRLEDGRCWGEAAFHFQWRDAALVLDPSARAPYAYLTRPRGCSKTTDMGGITLAVMLAQAPPDSKLYCLASDRDQARLLLDAIEGFVRRTPGLEELVAVSAYGAEVQGTGVTLSVLAADAASAWGLRPYFVVLDELAQWPETRGSRELLEAVRTATGKLNARFVVITTAGDPTHFAAELREHAREDPLWRLHETPGPVPWVDPERLAEQERALPRSSYARLHLNQWAEPEDRLATLAELEACITHEAPLPPNRDRTYALGLDVGLVRDRTALAICHLEWSRPAADGLRERRVVVDDLQTWEGTGESPVQLSDVREAIVAAARRYRVDRVVYDPHQAAMLVQELSQRGILSEEFRFTQQSNSQLATMLIRLIRDRQLALPNDAALLQELARVKLRETAPNLLRLDHRPGEHDDRTVALALAANYLLQQPDLGGGPRIRWLG